MTKLGALRRLFFIAIVVIPLGYLCYQVYLLNAKAANIRATEDRMSQLSLALNQYHETYDSFPPAFVLGPDGKRWHSWRTLLLPFLNESKLASEYRLDEPWDSPHNQKLVAACPEVFQSPHWGLESGRTNFYAVIGRRTAWPAQHTISLDQVVDGVENTIQLVEGPPVSQWLEPRDLTVQEYVDVFRNSPHYKRYIVLMDGSVLGLTKNLEHGTLASILTPSFRELMYSGPDWPEDLVDFVSNTQSFETQSISDLKSTDIFATKSSPLQTSRNQVWCATFQLAWDELRTRVGGNVSTEPKPQIVDQLNSEPFDRKALDPATYIAASSTMDPPGTDELTKNVTQKFPQLAPQFKGFPDDGVPDIRLYACLVKSMPFDQVCDRFPTPMEFRHNGIATKVSSFGRIHEGLSGLGEAVMQHQVVVGDYISDDDFILVLKTISPQQDEIVLAKIQPKETLQLTWEWIAERLKSPHANRVKENLHDAERLEIPLLKFGLTKQFDQLHDLEVEGLDSGVGIDGEFHIRIAEESILFQLDETGADLISEAEGMIEGENGYEHPSGERIKPRRFVLDQPFLLALREKGASEPYFLGWIAHPEVMVPMAP